LENARRTRGEVSGKKGLFFWKLNSQSFRDVQGWKDLEALQKRISDQQ
jgi:hypothetical protein